MPWGSAVMTESEFWKRIELMNYQEGLSLFVVHDQTFASRILNPSEFPFELEFQEKLWIGREAPQSGISHIPAKAGWILLDPPKLIRERDLVLGQIGVRTTWVEKSPPGCFENTDLKDLFSRCKKVLLARTRSVKLQQYQDPKPLEPRIKTFKCTEAAIEAMRNGWRFVPGMPVVREYWTLPDTN